ncbi:MAG: hotdog fold thioesterase [Chlamydiales bacterium]|nr:hotdog fold thioesterase [Chlamydiales bacterium]
MAIWKQHFDLALLNSWSEPCMMGHLGIVFTEIGEDFLVAQMPVDRRTRQPYGIMHGGASCVLAETVGSTAGMLCLNAETHFCLGLAIETHHIKVAQDGFVTGTARPLQLGQTIHIWDITITNEKQQVVSANRLTLAVRDRRNDRFKDGIPTFETK